MAGFNSNSYGPNDDGTYPCTGPGDGVPTGCTPSTITLPFSPNFFGTSSSTVYLNNNGNLTFGQPLGTYTPYPLSQAGPPIIAPFFADVDTRTGNTVTFGTGTVNGHNAWGVNWPGVGCYSQITSVLNTFQVLLIDRSDIAAGDFDIEFNYGNIQWDSGQASGGGTNCLGGTAGRAGYASGSGATGSYFELPGSGINNALLDSNTRTGLINSSYGSTQLGRYVYQFRNGLPLTTSGAPATAVGQGSGAVAVHNPTCSHGAPVNCASGEFSHTFTDVVIPGRGPALALTRTYNSMSAGSRGIFGYGWSSSYDMHLVTNGDGTVTITAEDGSQVTAAPVGGGSYGMPAWADSTLTHNGDGTWTYVRHQTQTFTFSAAGLLTNVADPNGYKTTLTYNGSGQLSTVVDPAGRSLVFAYGTNGLVSSITDPGSRVVRYGYDGAGNLTSVQDNANGSWLFGYDAGHELTTMTDPRNDGSTTNVYTNGQVTKQTDPMSRITTYAYAGANFSASGGSTTITDPNGNVEVQQYANGELMSLTRGSGSPVQATWTYTYDPNTLGRTSITDPNNHTSTAIYDVSGNQTSFADALNRQTNVSYNSLNEPLTIKDPSGVTTTRTYDASGNLLTVSRPLNGSQTQTVTNHYGDASHPGDVTSITDPDGHSTTFTYDGQGDLISVTDAMGDKTTYAYNVLGQRTSMVSARGNVTGGNPSQYTTTYQYDQLGRLKQTTDPLGHLSKRSYDGDGNLASTTDGDNNLTQYTYDADNEVTQITRADGTTLKYGYDGDGNQTSQTDGANHPTSYTYDPLSRVSSVTDPLTRKTSYGYDLAGNRSSLTDPSGRTTNYGYDAANELTSISYSDGVTPNVTFTYTANGLRQTMADGTGTTSYSYDQLNRLTGHSNSGSGQAVGYGYDLAGNLTSITYPNGHTVSRSYDTGNRLTGISDWLGHTTTLTPDPDSNVGTIAYPNGITATTAFDAADQLGSITDKNGGGSTVASFTYSRDGNGQLLSTTPTGSGQGSSETYSYSKLNQLATLNSASYTYDVADNVTKLANGATLGYDAANEATSYTPSGGSATTLSYDAQGNRTGSSSGSGATLTTSGNEITDAVRTANVQGDGRTPPDSSFGIWQAATNLETNGGFESGISGWQSKTHNPATISWDQTQADAKFGSGSLKVVTPGTNTTEGVENYPNLTVNPSTIYTGSVWVKAAAGATLIYCAEEHPSDNCHETNFTGTGAWQRLNLTFTTSSTTIALSLSVWTNGVQATTFWLDGAQIEAARIATPYVNTNGQTATRGNASVQAPSTLLSASQGWVAIRVRAEWSSSGPPGGGSGWEWLYDWRTDNNNRYSLYWAESSRQFTFIRMISGTSVSATWTAQTIAPGDVHTIIAKWVDANSIAISVDGGAFSTATITGTFTPSLTTFALGNNTPAQNPFDGEVLWAAAGTGTLTNTDATTLNNYGNTDPTINQLPGSPTFAWAANTAAYQTAGTSTASYSYDQANRLTTATVNATTSTDTYDGDGLRATQTTGGTTKHFAWDLSGSLPLLLTDGSISYLYDDTGTPIEQIDTSGTPLYYQHDQLGSTRLLTDQSGATAATYTYDPYGTLTSHTGATDTPLRWAGQYQDANGSYYLRARYYDPQTSQFLTRDPVGPTTQQIYSYAAGNPLNTGDPLGLWCWNPASLQCWTSDISAVAGTASAIVSLVPGLEPVAAGLAMVALASDVVGCLTSNCDYASVVFDALAVIPGAAAVYWSDRAEGYLLVKEMLVGVLQYDPWLGRIRYFEELALYVDKGYSAALKARAEAAGIASAGLSGTSVIHNLSSGEPTVPC